MFRFLDVKCIWKFVLELVLIDMLLFAGHDVGVVAFVLSEDQVEQFLGNLICFCVDVV